MSDSARFRHPEALQPGMHDARVLDDGEVRAERQFLEDATHAAGARRRNAARPVHAAVGDGALVRWEAAVDNVHDGRLAGAIVADQANGLARQDRQIDAVESLDCTEFDPDPARGDNRLLFGFNTHALGHCSSEIHG